MIKTIEININNGIMTEINALVVVEKNICYLNNKKYSVTNDFIERLKNIILLWENEYGNNRKIEEEFRIIITTNKKIETYHGKGIFPNNYQSLKELLGEL